MEIHLTQGKASIIDDVDADLATLNWYAFKGNRDKTSYAQRKVRAPDGKRTVVRLHQVIARRMGIVGPPDHIDRNGLNNRRSNLRADPNGRNQANQDIRSDNTSGFKGVSKKGNRWRAQLMVRRKADIPRDLR